MAATPPHAATPLDVRNFTKDEVEVANILLRLPYLVPLYESYDHVSLTTPSWTSKRPRSASSSLCTELSSSAKSQPCRLKGVPAVVSGEGSCRNASPDTPLLLKSSLESCSVQGSSECTTRDRKVHPLPEGRKRDGGVDNADDPAGIITSVNNLKRVNDKDCSVLGDHRRHEVNQTLESDLLLQKDMNLTPGSQPNGAHSRTELPDATRTPFQFDLNLLPESTGSQSSTPPASNDDVTSDAAGNWQGRN
ncbi:hypothetical protein MLD38_024817 [Melastoma candidum]|uniref:Uncharacterized protein n=1 Tax=Melastoma candidum TaxID=119954 RepID=A0ACB9NUT3_9MYRT|nr:hypothetical protein MLD38_024817 [Melastoma candidum]